MIESEFALTRVHFVFVESEDFVENGFGSRELVIFDCDERFDLG